MGEYIEFSGKQVKIGTCENLYYATLEQFKKYSAEGRIRYDESSYYLDPKNVFFWRFPFPDEDHAKEFGRYYNCDFERRVMFDVPNDVFTIFHERMFIRTDYNESLKNAPPFGIEIACPASNESTTDLKKYDWWKIATERTVFDVVQQIQHIEHDGKIAVRTVVKCPYCHQTSILEKDDEQRLVYYVERHPKAFTDLQIGIVNEIKKNL